MSNCAFTINSKTIFCIYIIIGILSRSSSLKPDGRTLDTHYIQQSTQNYDSLYREDRETLVLSFNAVVRVNCSTEEKIPSGL